MRSLSVDIGVENTSRGPFWRSPWNPVKFCIDFYWMLVIAVKKFSKFIFGDKCIFEGYEY